MNISRTYVVGDISFLLRRPAAFIIGEVLSTVLGGVTSNPSCVLVGWLEEKYCFKKWPGRQNEQVVDECGAPCMKRVGGVSMQENVRSVAVLRGGVSERNLR